jgi:competence ComEA-like helix-hairpin-helix protein
MTEIDINAASRDELASLPLIGLVLADRIIAQRERAGRFERLEDLLEVPGISTRIVDAIRGSARVGGGVGPGTDDAENPPRRPGKQNGGNPVLIHQAFIEHHLEGGTPATPEAYERAREQFQRLPGATRRAADPVPDDASEEQR